MRCDYCKTSTSQNCGTVHMKRLRPIIGVKERPEYYYTEIRVVDISSMCYNNMTIMRRMLLYGL